MGGPPPPPPGSDIIIVVYADDVTLLISHEKVSVAEREAQRYLDTVIQWLKENELVLADKTQAILKSFHLCNFYSKQLGGMTLALPLKIIAACSSDKYVS